MSEDETKATTLQRPANDDKEAWKAYWKTRGQEWRIEPEIDPVRQKYLAERCSIEPDIMQGIYPFKDVKLSRADVEWLLATHEDGRGPVDWSDERQRERLGLDLRGADLRSIDLNHLPLARIRAGLATIEWWNATDQERIEAGGHLEEAILDWAHLEGASFRWAHLEGTHFYGAYLQEARLRGAMLSGAVLQRARLEGASLCWAFLGGKTMPKKLSPANIKQVFLDTTTNLDGIILGDEQQGVISLVDASWGNVNLAVVDWAPIKMLGDEHEALKQALKDGAKKDKSRLLMKFQAAVRANRQLAIALQAQGLNEVAARFAYRAQKLQRGVARRQRKFGQYSFSLFLDLLAGYGYRPRRSLLWYFVIIFGFAVAYFLFGHLPLLPDALVFSLTSFHGRGFFPGLGNETSLHNPLVVLAAFEAVVGLLIEISFIATFTQRFFGK
jgi:uncharacterized protein YjbI with pentapeptide repeats